MNKPQRGMGWLALMIVLGIAAGGGYYAYQEISATGEAPNCAAAQNACLQKCRRTATEAAAVQSCQQACQREAEACASKQ